MSVSQVTWRFLNQSLAPMLYFTLKKSSRFIHVSALEARLTPAVLTSPPK